MKPKVDALRMQGNAKVSVREVAVVFERRVP
jgi:hypothetical protein